MRKNQAALITFSIGFIFSGVVLNFLVRANQYQNWPTAEAQIVQKERYLSSGEGRKIDIEYQFSINNTLHHGKETLYENDFNSLVSGSTINVAYNPATPEDNIAYASIGYGVYLLMSVVLMFFSISIYYLVISEEHYEKLLKRYDEKKVKS